MVGSVKSVGFSWDGSFVVGGSDEGTGLEIVSCPIHAPPRIFYSVLYGGFPVSLFGLMVSENRGDDLVFRDVKCVC